jgi:hypothetical protein
MRIVRFHTSIIGGFVLSTIVLTYPLIFHLTIHIPRHKAYGMRDSHFNFTEGL